MEVATPQEVADRISTRPGVHGLIVTTKEGGVVHTSMDSTATITHTQNFSVLEQMATSLVRDVDPADALLVLRIRSHRFEVLVKPDPNCVIYVIQKLPKPVNPLHLPRGHHRHH